MELTTSTQRRSDGRSNGRNACVPSATRRPSRRGSRRCGRPRGASPTCSSRSGRLWRLRDGRRDLRRSAGGARHVRRAPRAVRLEDGMIALRPITEAHIPAVVAACQDPEIPRWTRVPSPYGEADARDFLGRASDVWAIVGADPGIWDRPAVVGRGQRPARVLGQARGARPGCCHAGSHSPFPVGLAEQRRGLGVARVQLLTEPENRASQRVAEKRCSAVRHCFAPTSR